MSKILVITGLGYYKDQQGRVIAKAQLPPGRHDLGDDLIYVEVDNQADLDKIEIYQPPPTSEQLNVIKIGQYTRQEAITALKAAGQLPADFED